jgi:ABC-type multidrug transport system ATPase subunit
MKIRLDNIKKSYNKRTVLDIDSIEFERGRIYAVLGPNGSGKSTMVRIISGIDKPDCGTVWYDNERTFQKEQIAYLPQKPYIFNISVLKNVMLGINKGKVKNREEHALESLKLVGLEKFLSVNARSLSGGEMQRVAVARTLALGSRTFILDEPATSIDISSINLVENYIKKVKRENGSTVIFTTHSPSQAVRIADEAIFFFNGEVVERGRAEELIMNPLKEETKEFLKNWRIG